MTIARFSQDDQDMLDGRGRASPLGTPALRLLIGTLFNTIIDRLNTGAFAPDIASTANAKGASLVGIEDAAGDYTAVNAEAALVELAAFKPREIADPGNAGAIPIAHSGFVPLVTGGAETRTIADPTKVGLDLCLFFLTKVGNCVCTFASPVNAAGNNTLTHDTAGEAVHFKSVRDGVGTFAWRVVSNEAATPLSTV